MDSTLHARYRVGSARRPCCESDCSGVKSTPQPKSIALQILDIPRVRCWHPVISALRPVRGRREAPGRRPWKHSACPCVYCGELLRRAHVGGRYPSIVR